MPGTRRDLVKWFARRLTARRAHPRLVRAGSRFHLVLFRLFGGASGFGVNTLVLTARGRATGRPRSTPVNYVERDGTYFVAASFAGNDSPPQWYRNVTALPTVEVEVRRDRIVCSARVLTDDEAAAVWPDLDAMDPLYAAYRTRTARRIPVIALTPR